MFNRIKKTLRRALSSRDLQDLSQATAAQHQTSPPRVFRAPGSSTSLDTSRASQCLQESRRKLRRTAAQQDLRSVTASNEQPEILRRSPQTPQHRRPISRKEGNVDGANVLRGELSHDGSSVRLPSGEVLSLDAQSSSSSIDAIVQHEMSNPLWVDSQPSDATVIQHNLESDDKHVPQSQKRSPSQDPVLLDIREEYTNYKTQRKRARRILANDYVPDNIHPQKRRRALSASDRSWSPTPPSKKHQFRLSTTTPRLVQSQPELPRARRESIENDKTLSAVRFRGRRVWSANDVLHALHVGRQSGLSNGEVTPPPSPIISPETLKDDTYIHVLESPPARVPKLTREPLCNITEDFVPPFLKATSPTIQQQEPPTPGDVLDLTSEHSTVIFEEGNTTMIGLDDDVIMSEIHNLPVQDFGANTTKSNYTINSSLSTDLEYAGEDGLPKEPNIKHVLTDLDNDAQYIHGALKQIKALKTKVLRHEQKMLLSKNVRNHATDADAKDAAARYLLEAKAYRDAADKAEAEAKEYRKKAQMLIENAMAEVAMIRFGADDIDEEDLLE